MLQCCVAHLFTVASQFSEFCVYARAAKPTDETPRIEECIRLFNGVTTWVVSNILREFTMVKRAAVIDKFVECTRVSELLCWKAVLPALTCLSAAPV